MTENQFVTEFCKREGNKKQVDGGNAREALRIVQEMVAESPGEVIPLVLKKAKAKKQGSNFRTFIIITDE